MMRFCPRCHRQVPIPAFIEKIESGRVKIMCGNCRKGFVVIEPKP